MNSGGFRIILYSTFHPTHCSLLSRVQLTISSHMCRGFQFEISVTKNVIWSSKIRGKISEISYAFDLSSEELYSVKYPYEHTVAIAFIIMTNGFSNVFLPLCEFKIKSRIHHSYLIWLTLVYQIDV